MANVDLVAEEQEGPGETACEECELGEVDQSASGRGKCGPGG